MSSICWGHCFVEFPDATSFAEHCTKVAKQREQRKERRLYQKLKNKFELRKDG